MPLFLLLLVSCAMSSLAADPPAAEITNGKIKAKLYLPDAANGFYRGTRFDWSGIIHHLEAGGHTYYGPWFTKRNPAVRDFVYEGDDIVAGACSSVTGPADEFRPIGYDAAKPGGTFIKIGVGALRKPGAAPYDGYHLYEIANPGKWSVDRRPDSVSFTQTLNDAESGFAYTYNKTIRLPAGKTELVLFHSLKNTGPHTLETTVYNHNFLILDGKGPGPGAVITFPFQVQTNRPPSAVLAEIKGSQVIYKKTLTGNDVVSCPIEGFGAAPSDHRFTVENSVLKAGMTVHGDRPLQKVNLWSIRSNISVEPFIAISVAPGKEFTWTSTYRYYSLP